MKTFSATLFFVICFCCVSYAQKPDYYKPGDTVPALAPAPRDNPSREPSKNEDFFSEKDSARWKRVVATIAVPEYREYTTGYYKHHTRHYISYITFYIHGIKTGREVDDAFLYFSCRSGDLFAMLYDTTNTDHVHVMDAEPLLDPSFATDTTTGKIITADGLGDEIGFSYTINGVKKIRNQQLDIDNCMYNNRPDIVYGRLFRVIYEKEYPDRAIICTDQPLDTATFHFRPHNNIIGLSGLPLTKAALTYEYIFAKHFLLDASAALHYDPLHEAAFSARSGDKRKTNDYTDSYYEFKNASSYALGVKWYCVGNKAPLGFYTSLQAAFMSAQVKSDYVNKSGLEKDSTAIFFLSQSPENKVATLYSRVNAFGLRTGIGCSFFPDNSYRWMVDTGLGFQYYFDPADMKKNRIIDGTTYYYHDTPVWDVFLNLPVYAEISLCYKF